MTQLHVNMEARLYLKLKIALKELDYSSISEWAREMARSTIREAELRSTNRSKDIHRTEK